VTGTKEKILTAAITVFLDEGFQGLSMRRIAEKTGISAPAIYRHFEDKQDLVQGITEEALSTFHSYLWDGIIGESPMDRLRSTGAAYLRFAIENPRFYQIVTAPTGLFGGVEIPGDLLSRERAPSRALMDRLRECIQEGALAEDDVESLALTLWGMSHGLISLYLSGRIEGTPLEFENLYWASLLRLVVGLLPRDRPSGEPVLNAADPWAS